MRIVSLLPSTTEILFDLGAGDHVVGVTFECDHPPEARTRPIVSTSAMPQGLAPADIDAYVAEALRRGEDLYRLDEGALSGLDADLVVTQDLCAVCAVDTATVRDAMDYLACRGEVLTVDPGTLAEVIESIGTVGAAVAHRDDAERLMTELTGRPAPVGGRVGGEVRPRVLVLEWTDPPFAPGHWVPDMVENAGGYPVLGESGARSYRIGWDDVAAATPEVVVCAPCGFGLGESAALSAEIVTEIPAGVPVWAVDANASFARPGIRLVDGVEALAGIFHPDAAGQPDPEIARRVRS